jgi:uncharacterized protein YndB with AHSA1/START domain
MAESKFVYVTYIRTTPEKLWRALREPEFTRKFWVDTVQESDWTRGSSWKLVVPDGRVADDGEILEVDPCRRLVLTWLHRLRPEASGEGPSVLTYTLEPMGEIVKLTVQHEMGIPDSKLIQAVSGGWPMILASLKSLLETGESLPGSDRWPEGM